MITATTIKIDIDSQATKVHNGIVTARAPIQLNWSNDYVSGAVGTFVTDLRISANKSIGDGVTDTYDLFSGETDEFGDAVSFASVSGWAFLNKSTSNLDASLAGSWLATLLGSGNVIRVSGGGVMAWSSPSTGLIVVPSTSNTFTVTNGSGTALEYELFIWGTKA